MHDQDYYRENGRPATYTVSVDGTIDGFVPKDVPQSDLDNIARIFQRELTSYLANTFDVDQEFVVDHHFDVRVAATS